MATIIAGQMDPEAHAAAMAHLAVCSHCASSMAWLERTLVLMRAAGPGPAPALSAELRGLFRKRASPQQRPALPAQLHFDSGRAPRVYGLRSAPSVERQLLFAAGPLEVDLRLLPAGADWGLIGQVLGPAASGSAELFGPVGAFRAELNELAEFELAPVPAGSYRLTLSLPDVDLIIPELELGSVDATP